MEHYTSYDTERLLLRPTTEIDAEFVFELLTMPKWLQYIGDRNIKSVADAEMYIKEKMLPQLERLGYGSYTVIRKSDGVNVGSTGLYDREGLEGLDIGFAYLPQYEKHGYAFEAAEKLMALAFSEFGATKLSAITLEINTSSRKLLEKLGFTLEGPIRIPNDDAELLLYTIEASL